MTIPPRFLDELRNRLALSDIIGRKVRLTRAGREHKGCCPFHKEKTPSFYVNDEKQFYHCFGCGAHGSVIDFVMNHDNLSFIEAVENLAGEAGMPVPQSSPEDVKKANKAKSLHALIEEATQWMESQLRAPENRDAYDYITGRGVSENWLCNYRIGYAPADRQALRSFLKQQGYNDKDMIEAGVLRPGKNGGEPYAFFRERIMFPVPDRRGRIVAYGGRILPDHLRPQDQGDYVPAKYMNSANTPLFDKGRMLYGEPHARQAAIDGQPIIVVEGYVDVIACALGGFKGAVAPLGTALTEDQIPILWKMIPQDEKVPILCFDGDNAGRRAAFRAVERILPMLKPNQSARIAFLPDGQDPDSLINAQGASAFQAVLDAAMPLNQFVWQTACEQFAGDTPESRAALDAYLDNQAAMIPDRNVQFHYKSYFRECLYKSRSNRGNTGNAGRANSAGNRGYSNQNKLSLPMGNSLKRPSFSRVRSIESILLACILNYPALFERVEEQFGSLAITDKRLDDLRCHILLTLSDNPKLDSGGLQNHLNSHGFESEVKGILSEMTYTHAKFVRPNTEFSIVEKGWDNSLKVLETLTQEQDLNEAKKRFIDDMSAENESRFIEIKSLQNRSDGGAS